MQELQLYPAIDLIGAKAVRLQQGDYSRMTVYSAQPCGVARRFIRQGALRLHIVDLDGAKLGRPGEANRIEIGALVEQGHAFIEVGGGIRSEETVADYLALGVDRVILGTAALKDPAFTRRMAERYGEKIAVGVDAKDGLVAVNGWLEESRESSFTFCEKLRDLGVKTVIYTDIAKDGMLSGPNLEAYGRLAELKGLDIVASGGVSSIADIRALRALGIRGAILGKALYDGRLDLGMCLREAGDVPQRFDDDEDEELYGDMPLML